MMKTWLMKREFQRGNVKGRRTPCYLLVDYWKRCRQEIIEKQLEWWEERQRWLQGHREGQGMLFKVHIVPLDISIVPIIGCQLVNSISVMTATHIEYINRQVYKNILRQLPFPSLRLYIPYITFLLLLPILYQMDYARKYLLIEF